ncbi:MAG: DUF488 family protein [Desulfobulbaceae bacterium]|nr:DUF488 family protein [Desulfobulbaceae bacterium]
MDIRVKRAYERPDNSDGIRVLVDGIWPRGLRKEDAGLDEWLRDIAPSSGLRKWFNHDPARWEDFVEKYSRELDSRGELVRKLVGLAAKGRLTLVFAARDREHNNAVVLLGYLRDLLGG